MKLSSITQVAYINNQQQKVDSNSSFKLNKSINEQNITNEISFKGAKSPGAFNGLFSSIRNGYRKVQTKVRDILANTYGKFMLNNGKSRKVAEFLNNMDKNDASRHFQVVGSLVTSSAYMAATLKNKDIEKKNGRTLAINQGLGFVIPTIAAYATDSLLRGFNKTLEYGYSGIVRDKQAALKLTEEQAAVANERLSRTLKGFRALMPIVTFTMIYRYIVPVAITPLANNIGNWLNAKLDKEDADKKVA